MKTASIILNRNLPEVTEKLYETIVKNNPNNTDVFVIESGSDEEKLSKCTTWWANSPETMKNGLRFPRGFNYALSKLFEEKKFREYSSYFLVSNDSEFAENPFIATLQEELEEHPRVGILIPCSKSWGEKRIIGERRTRYFCYGEFISWFVRREFMEAIINYDPSDSKEFFFDGNNFRGYGCAEEMIAKGYANDWATAITTKVMMRENEEHLMTKADLIKTESINENMKKYIREGREWMKKKYGFNYRWSMQVYARIFYDKFFDMYPIYKDFRV